MLDGAVILTRSQCRAARALLDWKAAQLADAAGLSLMTVKRFELGQTIAEPSLQRIAQALREAGVTLLATGDLTPGGEGVRLTPKPE